MLSAIAKRRLGALTLIAAGILLGLGCAELVLRLAGVSYPTFHQGNELITGAEGWWTYEGRGYVRINSDGLRDSEHAIAKPAGTYRIAVIGDSYAEAMQVNREEAFWSVLGRELQRCPAFASRQVEMLNFGVAGYGTALELQRLEAKAWKYQPDLVLLAFTTGNDIRDNSIELEDVPTSPYYTVQDGQLVLSRPEPVFGGRLAFARGGWYWLVAHSRVAQLVNFMRQRVKLKAAIESTVAAAGGMMPQGVDGGVFVAPTRPEWARAWEITERLLDRIHQSSRAHGVPLLVATLSNSMQVNPDAGARAAYAAQLGVADLDYPDRRVAGLGQSRGWRTLALAPALRQWAQAQQRCVHGFPGGSPCEGHWNQDGHRVAGEALAAALCSRLPESAMIPRP